MSITQLKTSSVLIPITIVGWSLWSIFNKLALQKLHPFYVGLIGSCVSVCLIPMYILLLKNNTSNNTSFNVSGFFWIILASLCTVVASLAFLFGVRAGDVGKISVLSNTHPALTFLLAIFIFNEQITLIKLFGIALIICGSIALSV